MIHPDTKLLSDIEAAKKMMLDEQSNKGQLRGIIQFMQKAVQIRKAKRCPTSQQAAVASHANTKPAIVAG